MKLLSIEELRKKCPVKWKPEFNSELISLGMADIDYEGPQGINQYLKDNLEEGFSYYQSQHGLPGAINAANRYLNSRGVKSEDNIQIIPGTMMGIYAAQKWASRREGEVLYIEPLYEPIHRHGRDLNQPSKFIQHADIMENKLQEMVNSNTKLLALNNPNNPTGRVYSKDELKMIRDIAIDNDLICFSDELYAPLVFERSVNKFTPLASLPGMEERTIALYGFSKAYGLAGYRSGFMYLGDRIKDEVRHIVESQLVSPSPISSIVCEWALTNKNSHNWVRKFNISMAERTKFAAEYLLENGIESNIPDSCFFIYPDIKVDDIKFSEFMINENLWVVPGSVFGPSGKNRIRINCGTSEERLKKGLKYLLDGLDKFTSIAS